MTIDEHLTRTNGRGKKVHEFMDQFSDAFGADHRVIFHHSKGVDLLVAIFGEKARPIIMQHLKDDHYGSEFRAIPSDHKDNLFRPYDSQKYERAIALADSIYIRGSKEIRLTRDEAELLVSLLEWNYHEDMFPKSGLGADLAEQIRELFGMSEQKLNPREGKQCLKDMS